MSGTVSTHDLVEALVLWHSYLYTYCMGKMCLFYVKYDQCIVNAHIIKSVTRYDPIIPV